MPTATDLESVSRDGHVLIQPDQVGHWDEVRPPGWSLWHLAIGFEDMGDGWVKVLWEVSDRQCAAAGCASPVDAFTMFEAHELLERR